MMPTFWDICSHVCPFFIKTSWTYHVVLHNEVNPKKKQQSPLFGKLWQNNTLKNILYTQHKLSIKHNTHKYTEKTTAGEEVAQ